MITQTVTVTEKDTQNIIIGRRGTYDTERIVFDVSYMAQLYGDGTAVLMVKRPADTYAYEAQTTRDGETVVWVISETDTAYKGHGECELYWYVGGEALAKSVIFSIAVLRDIGDSGDEPPDPYETWVDEIARLSAETQINADKADAAEKRIEQIVFDAITDEQIDALF